MKSHEAGRILSRPSEIGLTSIRSRDFGCLSHPEPHFFILPLFRFSLLHMPGQERKTFPGTRLQRLLINFAPAAFAPDAVPAELDTTITHFSFSFLFFLGGTVPTYISIIGQPLDGIIKNAAPHLCADCQHRPAARQKKIRNFFRFSVLTDII